MQDFSKPWSDAELYKKYNLTKEEIDFIESMIKPMAYDLFYAANPIFQGVKSSLWNLEWKNLV